MSNNYTSTTTTTMTSTTTTSTSTTEPPRNDQYYAEGIKIIGYGRLKIPKNIKHRSFLILYDESIKLFYKLWKDTNELEQLETADVLADMIKSLG